MDELLGDIDRHALGENLLTLTDSYKISHWKQYPPNTTSVSSYLESRKGAFPEVLFNGLQYTLKRYLEGKVVSESKIREEEWLARLHLNDRDRSRVNRAGWEHILDEHGGRLPLSIRAVPEGTVVPTGNVLIVVENTDPDCYWLTSYIEPLIVQSWYPQTVGTLSLYSKARILKNLVETGTPELAGTKLHDFGLRGATSIESAAIGGAAHLINFTGTDNDPALILARNYYGEEMAGYSIDAAEHSTITSWGRENEVAAMRNMLDQFPTGAVSIVSDSYDIYAACRDIWGETLRDRVLSRDGVVVVRPDSGDPLLVAPKVVEILGDKFGYTVNAKGYRVLNDKIRVIQGDGMDYEMVGRLLDRLKGLGWSGDNMTFGMGGALLQKMNRDTQSFAFKCSHVVVDGRGRDVYKQPVTDSGKGSKRGRLKLVLKNGTFRTVPEDCPGRDELVDVFRDGRILKEYPFAEVRRNAAAGLERIMATA